MSYATLAELKAQIDKDTSGDDTELQAILDAVTVAIDTFTNRPDGFEAAVASARTFAGPGGPWMWIDECTSVTLVEVKTSPTDTTFVTYTTDDWDSFSGDPLIPDFQRLPIQGLMITASGDLDDFTSGRFTGKRGFKPTKPTPFTTVTVRVTATWGYADTVPLQIKQACIIQSARWYKRGQSAWSDVLGTDDFGRLQLQNNRIDADLLFNLKQGRFIKPAIGAR